MSDPASSRLTQPKTIFSLDYRALAAFRIGLALVLVYDILTRSGDALAFYTDFGLLPRTVFIEKFTNPLHVSIHLGNGSLGWIWFLLAVQFVFALMLLFGFKTRLATIVSWALLLSLHNRNPMILNSGDFLFRLLFFWGMFLPLGMKYSVDAALAKDDPPKEPRYFAVASVALICQVLIVYIATVLLKTGWDWLPGGLATYYALSLDAYTSPLGQWLSQFHGLLRVITYGAFFLEAFGPILLISPLFFDRARTITVFLLIGMHLSFDVTIGIGMFPYVDVVSLIVLLPSSFWDSVLGRLERARRGELEIRYDGGSELCEKLVRILATFLLIPQTKIAPAQESEELAALLERENSWIVRDGSGKEALRYEALVAILEHSPLAGWLGRRLPLRKLRGPGDRLYGWVAARRTQLTRSTSACLPWGFHPPAKAGAVSSLLCLFFFGYVVYWNLTTLPQFDVKMSEPWTRIASVLRLDQKWSMFAPFPMRDDGWYVVEGELRDGTKVDVGRKREEPPSYEKPALVSRLYKNARWRKYLLNIWMKKNEGYRVPYAEYLCRVWNTDAARPDRRKLANLEISFMLEQTPPPGEPTQVHRVTVLRHECVEPAAPSAPKPTDEPPPTDDPSTKERPTVAVEL